MIGVQEPKTRWMRLPLAARGVIIVLALVVGLNLLAQFVESSTGGGGTPGGRESSSYATQNEGLAAYAELLIREGHPVQQTRGSFESNQLDPSTTMVVLDPDTISRADADALLVFVTDGGRLVIGGANPRYFDALLDNPPVWDSNGPTRYSQIASALAPIRSVVSAGKGAFENVGRTVAIVGSDDAALVTETSTGRGTIMFVADASVLQNQRLATDDNAALGLFLAGDAGRTVVFPEGVHGYGPSRGLSAIPSHWKLALAGLAFAGLVLIWARGHRLGPAEDSQRALPPRRSAYVDALGSTLARTHQPADALLIVTQRVNAYIDARAIAGADGDAGATGDLDPAEFARRAHAAGMSDEEIAALGAPITDDSVLALGRALSRVVETTGKERQ